MTYDYQIGDGAHSIDQMETLKWLRGWQVINASGGSNLVTPSSTALTWDVASGDINAGGTTVTCSSGTVDVSGAVDADNPRKVTIYRDANGNAQFSAGTAEAAQPSGATQRNAHRPAPPPLHNTDGVILATTWLEAGKTGTFSTSDRRDRRLPAEMSMDQLTVLTGVSASQLEGSVVGGNTVTSLLGDGIEVSSNALRAALGSGVEFASGSIQAAIGQGLEFASGDVQLLSSIWDGTNIVADVNNSSVTTGVVTNNYHYAGGYSGADADARLDAAISAASGGDTIYLEADTYSDTRGISKTLTIIGASPGNNVGTEITGDWTINTSQVVVKMVRLDGTITVDAAACQFSHISSGTITFNGGTSAGIVDTCESTSVTDNGSNTVGDIS